MTIAINKKTVNKPKQKLGRVRVNKETMTAQEQPAPIIVQSEITLNGTAYNLCFNSHAVQRYMERVASYRLGTVIGVAHLSNVVYSGIETDSYLKQIPIPLTFAETLALVEEELFSGNGDIILKICDDWASCRAAINISSFYNHIASKK